MLSKKRSKRLIAVNKTDFLTAGISNSADNETLK